jgi:hypothetical protein
MKFRIQERKYSSNIIEKQVGKSWTPYLAPLVTKKEGDIIVEQWLRNFDYRERLKHSTRKT